VYCKQLFYNLVPICTLKKALIAAHEIQGLRKEVNTFRKIYFGINIRTHKDIHFVW